MACPLHSVDDMLPKREAFLQTEWIPVLANWTSASIPQSGVTRVSSWYLPKETKSLQQFSCCKPIQKLRILLQNYNMKILYLVSRGHNTTNYSRVITVRLLRLQVRLVRSYPIIMVQTGQKLSLWGKTNTVSRALCQINTRASCL